MTSSLRPAAMSASGTTTPPLLPSGLYQPYVQATPAPAGGTGGVTAMAAIIPAMPSRQASAPGPPKFASEGLPDPASIERQKKAYGRSLDAQLEEGSRVIAEQNRARKEALQKVADQYKAQYYRAVDTQMRAQEAVIDKQMNLQLLSLQQAAFEQKMNLEHQVSSLKMEYGARKAQEDFAARQADLHRQKHDVTVQIHSQLQANIQQHQHG
eukprot:NODE_11604_length_1275_cov_14.364983.p1 GENE.NODE_11604_length_1275_cov_14.364983~~NODE_11604_length_1275_cov_14.364983.p1  ORF type:complete len:211 (-),score=58.64 NODE_11604_length_1275_cov_14.364983:480-1112(-)